MIADFDFFSLVETWHKENNSHDFSVNGYNLQCFYRASLSRRAKRGSGGIAVYIKEQLTGGIEKIKDTNLTIVEDRVWFRMCKEFFGLENDLYLGIWYIPPFGSCRYTQHQGMWENLEWEVSYFQEKGDVILMGDLNARTGEMNDWIALDQTDNFPLPYDSPRLVLIGVTVYEKSCSQTDRHTHTHSHTHTHTHTHTD